MGKIVEIPFTENLVDHVATELIAEGTARDFSSACVVFPHHRPVYYLRRAMAERLQSTFFPPQIYSIDEFMAYVSSEPARRPVGGGEESAERITSLDAAYLLFQIVTELPRSPWKRMAGSFAQFLPWGLKLAGAIEELDVELIGDEHLKSLEMIEHWEAEVAHNAAHLMNHLAKIRKKFHAVLEEHSLTSRGADYMRAAERVEKSEYSNPFSSIYFVGLFAMTCAEKTVVRHLLKNPAATFIRQSDGARWSPFTELDTWAKKESAVEVVRSETSEQGTRARPKINLYSAFDTHSEIVGLKDVLLGKRVDKSEETAIVLPRSESLIPLLSEVMTAATVDYNISMGYPLLRTPVYALLEPFMKLHETRRDDTYYLKDYLSLLMHPYVKNVRRPALESAHMRVLIHSLEEVLSAQGKAFLKLDEVEGMEEIFLRAARMAEGEVSRKDFKDALSTIHDIFIRRMAEIKTLAGLARYFQEVLTFILRNSQAAHYPFSGEFFHSFFQLLDKVKSSLVGDEEFREPGELFDLFRSITRNERISFQGVPLKGLQILGLLETRCLNFKRLFLLDLNEGVLPSVVPEDSLFPRSLRAELGLPLHYADEEIYRYHFSHLLSSGEEVHIFYRETEADFRSRFVEEVVWEEEKRAGEIGVLKAKPLQFNVSLRPSSGLEIPKGEKVLEVLRGLEFSASSLNSYLRCPAQFYFGSVLLLEEKERMADELDITRTGTLLHEILKKLYQDFQGGDVLGRAEYARLKKSLPMVVDEVFSETFGEARGEYYLLKKLVLERLKNYIVGEEERFVDKLSVVSIELPLKCAFELGGKTIVQLKGRSDRIDSCGDEYTIIDYKSARDLRRHSFGAFDQVFSSRDEMKEKIKSFQLPLYTLLWQRDRNLPPSRVNSKLISLRTSEEELLFKDGMDREAFLESIFLPNVKNLISEILNPEVPFARDASNAYACQYCPFETLCRK